MTKPTGGLGRGLGALIPQKIAPPPETDAGRAASAEPTEVPVDSIVENPHQPRKFFSPSDLEDLLSSIKEHGILQPLVVTRIAEDTYELIAGERRLRASRMLGLKMVPVVIRRANDQQKLELALIENIQRQDLNPIEEAQAYQALIDQFSLSQDDVAKRVGKSRPHVANTVRLLDLSDEMLEALSSGKITKSHARTLLAESDVLRRDELFKQMLAGGMTVRQAEAKAGARTKVAKAVDPNVAAMEADLRESLGTKVTVDLKAGSGKITIHFYSKEELKELLNRLTD
ncbi:MAG: ParB/RepB/Spo0J family partition protein [Candidatus Uhrbacteria bacterium]|nr:ParB/RepB/Spo0J family partition protein [Candidatus Uhrbacteria bacterium]